MTPGFGPRPDFGEEKRTVVGINFLLGEERVQYVWRVKRDLRERLRYYWLKLRRMR